MMKDVDTDTYKVSEDVDKNCQVDADNDGNKSKVNSDKINNDTSKGSANGVNVSVAKNGNIFQRIFNGIFKTDFGVKYNLTNVAINSVKYKFSNLSLKDRSISVFGKGAGETNTEKLSAKDAMKLMKDKLKRQSASQPKLTPEEAKQKFIEFAKHNCVDLDRLKMENHISSFMKEYKNNYYSEEAQYKLVKIRSEISKEMKALREIMNAIEGVKKGDALYFHKYQVQVGKFIGLLEEISLKIDSMTSLSFSNKK
jgi:hypothetical protein